MSDLAPVSLLRRGALAIPEGASPAKIQMLKNAIPKNYIVDMVQNTPAVSSGSRVFVIKSGTGSGKSTTLPTALSIRGRRIAVTEPRRLTAEEAPYDIVSYDGNFKLGENIGFQTGLINKSPKTGVVFMTIGILRQHILKWDAEKFMRRYSTLMIDEVHEHNLETDVLLRLVKQFLNKHWNNPMCPAVVLMSATMDPKKYQDYFETTNVVEVSGISFPIEPHWPNVAIGDLPSHIVELCRKLKGDTLIFMPTAKTITKVAKMLSDDNPKDTVVEIMAATIAKGEVKQLLKPSPIRRIALATNAAETGLTLPYLNNIIDTGLSFQVAFNPQYNCTAVAQLPISQASALQRKGRVGRKFNGDWYPLYSEETFKNMIQNNPAEIYTKDTAGDLLILITALTESKLVDGKVEFLSTFDPATIGLIHDPSGESMSHSYDKLYQLGMINSDWTPTVTGYLTSKLRKITIESAKTIFSADYHKADIYKLIVISAILHINNLGAMDKFGVTLFDDKVRCGFIRVLLIYEMLQRQIKRMSAKNLSSSWIKEWCTDMNMNYDSWVMIIEYVYELTFQFMELGIKVDMNSIPLIDILEADRESGEIAAIKNCLYEGYRLNTASWNSFIQGYVTTFKHAKIATAAPIGRATNIMCNEIIYRNMSGQMSYVTSDFVCILDDHITLDNHFMY